MKTEIVQARVTPELKDTLRRMAADNSRTQSQQLEYLIKQEARKARKEEKAA